MGYRSQSHSGDAPITDQWKKLEPPNLSCTMSNNGANRYTCRNALKTNVFLQHHLHHPMFPIGAACTHVGQKVPPFPAAAPGKIRHAPGAVQWIG
jgi:hypothetical protein